MNIILPGVQRCGTTSLRTYLSRHPALSPPKRREIEYFSEHYDKGPQWYRIQLGRGHLDKSPNYLANPAAPARIARDLPNARIVILLRDPVYRAWSHYRFAREILKEKRPFSQAMHSGPGRTDGWHSYLKRGHYAEQLTHWLKHIPREQILIVQSERFFAYTGDVYREIVRFLGLSPFVPKEFRRHGTVSTSGTLDAEALEWLSQYYGPYNEALYDLLEKDLGWN